jgi:hypothetical protein
LATTLACGPVDELVALHEELGILAALDAVVTQRQRAGLADALLLRTLATLPFLAEASLGGAAEALFGEPALLLQLGWAPVQIRAGDNGRHRHPDGRQPESLPCHPDTLRDALRRVAAQAWQQVQDLGVQALYAHRLVRGKVYAIDGSGIGPDLRLVALVCVSGERPLIVAWRLLTGHASEKGKEAAVTRALIEPALALGGPTCIALLLADALYADGPLLAWLKFECGIDALVRLPEDRLLYAELQRLAALGRLAWTEHRCVRVVQGHKHLDTVAVTSSPELTDWDSFVEAATRYGQPHPTLWAGLIRPLAPTERPAGEAWALVSTRAWPNAFVAWQAYRPRWHIENDAYRELKAGWGLEAQRWGRDAAVAQGRLTLTCLAFNTAQVYRARGGAKLAQRGIRRLRQVRRPEVGAAPVVVYAAGCYAVLALEELLALVGTPVRASLLPATRRSPPAPT